MDDRTIIDPQRFSVKFAQVAIINNFKNDELAKEAKRFLLSYLTAYYLVGDFNAIEKENFGTANTEKFKDMSFDELLKRVSELNKY